MTSDDTPTRVTADQMRERAIAMREYEQALVAIAEAVEKGMPRWTFNILVEEWRHAEARYLALTKRHPYTGGV